MVWLGSAASAHVNGRMFEAAGGRVSVADGWRSGPHADKGARWHASEVGGAVSELLARAQPPQPVYGS
ncbi:short chain dehydrogenase [compost metagenome]